MTKEQYELIENYMLQNTGNCSHDKMHTYRVLNNAIKISKKEKNIDMSVIIASALLHDIARHKEKENKEINHAIEGANRAYSFLIKNNFSEKFANHVKECIQTHRFRSNNQPKTKEAKIIFDADKLDVIGPIGVARTLMYNGEHNQPLYYLDSNGKIDYSLNDEAKDSFIREYNYKLVKMYKIFFTKEGRRLSKKNKLITQKFYKQLIKQLELNEIKTPNQGK